MKLVTYGQIAYEAYCRSSWGKSLVSGDVLPAWDALNEDVRDAWIDAGHAVAEQADADTAGSPEPARYARVEQMGYRSRVCAVTETELAGRKMLRLTVLPAGTVHDISPDSIYEITWLTRDQAEQATRTGVHAPAAIGRGEPGTTDDDDDPWRGDPLGDLGDDEDRERYTREQAEEGNRVGHVHDDPDDDRDHHGDEDDTDEASYHARRAAEADL